MILIVSSTTAITLKIDPSVVLATRKYVDDKVIEVKLYADNLMKAHTSAADPHPQYAPKASPVFTGSPKAPTPAQADNSTLLATTAYVKTALAGLVGSAPAALDTLNELAAALGNDPKFATTMLNALAGKQPLDTTLNALSGKSVAALLEYLGLGEAAKRNVGNTPNQIPDMSFFNFGGSWFKQPNGWIIQGFSMTLPAGVTSGTVTFPVPFPLKYRLQSYRACYCAVVALWINRCNFRKHDCDGILIWKMCTAILMIVSILLRLKVLTEIQEHGRKRVSRWGRRFLRNSRSQPLQAVNVVRMKTVIPPGSHFRH